MNNRTKNKKLLKIFIVLTSVLFFSSCKEQNNFYDTDPLRVSQNLLYSVKVNENFIAWTDTIGNISMESLKTHLNNDNSKKVFWINIYNAYIQIFLKKDTSAYIKKDAFFNEKKILIKGELLSLNDIEQGFLGRNNNDTEFKNQFQLTTTDPRIHFALNYGASSCPIIRFYEVGKIEEQLNLATQVYLKYNVEYDAIANTVSVPAIMNWYKDDFNGKEGILSFLKKSKEIPGNVHPKIKFMEFDWTIHRSEFE